MSEEIDRLVEAARAYNRARKGANAAEDCPRCDDDYGMYCGQHTQLRAVARDAKRRLFDAVFAIGIAPDSQIAAKFKDAGTAIVPPPDPCPQCGKQLVAQASGVVCSCGYMFCY